MISEEIDQHLSTLSIQNKEWIPIRYYLSSESGEEFSILQRNSEDLEFVGMLKGFVEKTLLELGEDWRVESRLLVQELGLERQKRVVNVMASEPSNQNELNANHEICIFNEFLLAYLKPKIKHLAGFFSTQKEIPCPELESEQSAEESSRKKRTESEEEEDEFTRNLDRVIMEKMEIPVESQYKMSEGNLTFNTLSLGFCIIARDVWQKAFLNSGRRQPKGPLKDSKVQSVNNSRIKYLGTLLKSESSASDQCRWLDETDQIGKGACVKFEIEPHSALLQKITSQMAQIEGSEKYKVLSGIVFCEEIHEFAITNSASERQIVRILRLSKRFYLQAFSVWLIFSIKKSFVNLNPADYIRYFGEFATDCESLQNGREEQTSVAQILTSFHQICTSQWKSLMKDYFMVLNDDREILQTLIKRISAQVETTVLDNFKACIQEVPST